LRFIKQNLTVYGFALMVAAAVMGWGKSGAFDVPGLVVAGAILISAGAIVSAIEERKP
jgi:hypothetical protein